MSSKYAIGNLHLRYRIRSCALLCSKVSVWTALQIRKYALALNVQCEYSRQSLVFILAIFGVALWINEMDSLRAATCLRANGSG